MIVYGRITFYGWFSLNGARILQEWQGNATKIKEAGNQKSLQGYLLSSYWSVDPSALHAARMLNISSFNIIFTLMTDMYQVVEICLLPSVDVQQRSHGRGTWNSQTSPSPALWNSCGSDADFQLSKRQRDGLFPRSKPWGVLKCDPARRSWTCGCRSHTGRDGVCYYGDGGWRWDSGISRNLSALQPSGHFWV